MRQLGVLATTAALGAGLVAAGPAAASPAGPVGTPPEVITPLVAKPLSSPHPVLGADGRVHLVYELLITNPTSSMMRLEKLETLDSGRHDSVIGSERGPRIIATLAGRDLDGATKPLVPVSTLTLRPAEVTRLFLDATFARTAHLPRRLEHRFAFTLTPSGGSPSTQTVISGSTRVINDPPVVIGPPLAGTGWVVGGGCCFPASYHRTATLPVNGEFHAPERFAIDFIQLRADNALLSGPLSDLHSYEYFGDKVLSVADGVVVGLQDGLPEQTPPNFPANATAQTAGGNYLVINIGHGHFAFYAHMQPHSLQVHVGEHVKQGQVIGLLGNTGNSDAPHLHFHIMNGPGPLSSDGLPFELRSFRSLGTITSPLEHLFTGKPASIGPASRGLHRHELPLENEVISFPAAAPR
jgi:Peptidase family M23